MITPEIEQAIDEIRASFDPHPIRVDEDGEGGAVVVVQDLDLGPLYTPRLSWCAFHITFQYPHADVYPHYFVPELARVDEKPLGESFSGPVDWRERKATQVSRRSNHMDAAVDTAAVKLHKVLAWLRSR